MKIACLFNNVSKHLIANKSSFIPKYQAWSRSRVYTTTTVSPFMGERVTVTSREMIKPSTPTSPHTKPIYFSLIDQIAPTFYNSIVLFYENDPKNVEKGSKLLRESLSETLVDFYPLAGRIHKNELIECNDEGVEFCEAQVSANLLDFIENPGLPDLKALLPFQDAPTHKNIVVSVQINHFSCSGMAIGVCISHKITDGGAVGDFLTAWAAKTINSNHNISRPEFNAATLFPPLKELNELIVDFNLHSNKEIIPSTRRLIFDKQMIDELKVQAAVGRTVVRPTTTEVITGFIWKHAPQFSIIVHMVNLRRRVVPIIPDSSFGNFILFTNTSETGNFGGGRNLELLVNDIRKATKRINDEYVQELFIKDMSRLKKMFAEMCAKPPKHACLAFTSIAGNSSLYELNFGKGEPVWACVPSNVMNNFVFLMPTKSGDGIEAWISMDEDDIVMLHNSLSQLGYPLVKHVRMN